MDDIPDFNFDIGDLWDNITDEELIENVASLEVEPDTSCTGTVSQNTTATAAPVMPIIGPSRPTKPLVKRRFVEVTEEDLSKLMS